MQKDDIRLQHMLDAATEALSFAEGRRREDLAEDRQLALSLIKLIEIIGEAATQLDRSTHEQAPEIAWREIIGMRNRLAHGYFDIDLDLVWDTVQVDLAPLVTLLSAFISRRGFDWQRSSD